MMSMVERIARLEFKLRNHPGAWEECPDWYKSEVLEAARLLIAEMREPSEAMIAASSDDGLGRHTQAVRDWRAMIDAALAEARP